MNGAIVIGIALLAGFLVALYGFLCLVSLQAFALTTYGWVTLDGVRAGVFGLFVFGAGGVVFLQCLSQIERRYASFAKKGTIGCAVVLVIGAVGCLYYLAT